MNLPTNHAPSHLEWINDGISVVLDPLAERCGGWPTEAIRPLVHDAWHDAFGVKLGEPALTDTAAAIHDGRPWSEALWTDGW